MAKKSNAILNPQSGTIGNIIFQKNGVVRIKPAKRKKRPVAK